MYFDNIGYDYIDNDEIECFDNIYLLYNGEDVYWITCSDKNVENFDEYFNNGEIILFGFYLKKKIDYKMIYSTKITYDDIIEDMNSNNIEKYIKLKFSSQMFEQLKKFKIIAHSKDEAIEKIKTHLSLFEVIIK